MVDLGGKGDEEEHEREQTRNCASCGGVTVGHICDDKLCHVLEPVSRIFRLSPLYSTLHSFVIHFKPLHNGHPELTGPHGSLANRSYAQQERQQGLALRWSFKVAEPYLVS